MIRMKKYLILLTIAGAIVAFDQATKMYVHTQFQLSESIPVVQDIFHFTYVRNTGAAFGIFRESAESFRNIFFLSMPPLALLIILVILRGVAINEKVQIVALSAIFGGAIGNYIDRIRFGYVIDFLDVHYKSQWAWPAFNIADSAIVIGVGILILIMIKQWRDEAKAEATSLQ